MIFWVMIKTEVSLFFSRIKRVCLFDSRVYSDTRNALFSAFIIVLLVALSHGIGGMIRARINNWDPRESFVFGFQGEIAFWLVQSIVFFLIAKLLLHKPIKLREILSSTGYAIFPGVLVILASLLQGVALSVPMLILLAIYRLATCTAALYQLLNIKLLSAILMVVAGSVTGFLSLGLLIKLTEWIS